MSKPNPYDLEAVHRAANEFFKGFNKQTIKVVRPLTQREINDVAQAAYQRGQRDILLEIAGFREEMVGWAERIALNPQAMVKTPFEAIHAVIVELDKRWPRAQQALQDETPELQDETPEGT